MVDARHARRILPLRLLVHGGRLAGARELHRVESLSSAIAHVLDTLPYVEASLVLNTVLSETSGFVLWCTQGIQEAAGELLATRLGVEFVLRSFWEVSVLALVNYLVLSIFLAIIAYKHDSHILLVRHLLVV